MATVPIDSIKVGERIRQNLGSITDLAVSIDEIGLLHPVVVLADNTLIAGARRLAAVTSLGWKEVPVTVVDSLDALARALQAERDENTCRKDFTPTEAAEMRDRIAKALKPKADAAKAATQAQKGEGKVGGSKLERPEPVGRTRKVAAQATGLSSSTLDKVDAVKRALESDIPEVRREAQHAWERMQKTGKVDPAFKAVQKAEVEAIDDGSIAAAQWVAAIFREIARSSITTFETDRLALLADDELWDALSRFRERLNAWFDEAFSKKPTNGLRRVK